MGDRSIGISNLTINLHDTRSMSNNSRNYRRHKRQKSSVLGGSYYFPPENESQAPYLPTNNPSASRIGSNELYNLTYKYPNRDSPLERLSLVSSGEASSQIEYQSQEIMNSSAPSSSNTFPQNLPYNLNPPLHSTGYGYGDMSSMIIPQQSSIPLNLDRHNDYIQYAEYKAREAYSSTENEMVYYPSLPTINVNRQPAKQHQKNNLSISSHFNLFSLNEENLKPNLVKTEVKDEYVPTTPNVGTLNQFTNPSNMQNFQSTRTVDPTPNELRIQNIEESPSIQDTVNLSIIKSDPDELFTKLFEIDGSTLGQYLLDIVHAITIPVPLDDFYNLLYNSEDLQGLFPKTEYLERIDKTIIGVDNKPSVQLLSQILTIFRTPDLLLEYFPDSKAREIKLLNVNYHELLRTFLAIKILSDVLIEVKDQNPAMLQEHTIPRLSIYKVYYIICQQLILKYPSKSNTTNEQQKLILGRSKLGKLIKLVYPNLLIKRLGSRGESKYNYLGIIWNQDLVSEETKDKSEKYELDDLSEFFGVSNFHSRSMSVVSNSSQLNKLKLKSRKTKVKPVDELQEMGYQNPNLSFVNTRLKYPSHSNFGILPDNTNLNWFDEIKSKIYSEATWIQSTTISDIIFNEEIMSKNGLLAGLMNEIIQPLLKSMPDDKNIDLKLYLLILIEILPFILLVREGLDTFLKILRQNILNFISSYIQELNQCNGSRIFSILNAVTFLVLLKKLLNLNDLELSFSKIFIDEKKRSLMALDIKKFLESNFDPLLHSSNSSANVGVKGSVSFKDEVLSKDLIDTLIGYDFDPTRINQKSNISFNYIMQEIEIIDTFFKNDLVMFLNSSIHPSSDSKSDILSNSGPTQLMGLLSLIEQKLLSAHFKSKYPILVFNTYINLIFNDILKFVFFKDQTKDFVTDSPKESNSSFRYFWVFHSLVQELLSLYGEIVGLHDKISLKEKL